MFELIQVSEQSYYIQSPAKIGLVKLGGQGVWADDGKEGPLIPCAPGSIVNTSGCGDAFVAGAADAYLRGLGTMESARRGLAAAAICAEDSAAVSPRMSEEAVEARLSL